MKSWCVQFAVEYSRNLYRYSKCPEDFLILVMLNKLRCYARGVTIHRKYGSPQYKAGGSVHGPFLVISVRFSSPQKISSKDKIKKKIAETLLKCCFYVESYLILLY